MVLHHQLLGAGTYGGGASGMKLGKSCVRSEQTPQAWRASFDFATPHLGVAKDKKWQREVYERHDALTKGYTISRRPKACA